MYCKKVNNFNYKLTRDDLFRASYFADFFEISTFIHSVNVKFPWFINFDAFMLALLDVDFFNLFIFGQTVEYLCQIVH